MLVTKMTSKPMLHITDNATGMYSSVITDSRYMDEAARHVEAPGVTFNGAPTVIMFDTELDNGYFKAVLKRHANKLRPWPAGKHGEIGSVEIAYGVAKTNLAYAQGRRI